MRKIEREMSQPQTDKNSGLNANWQIRKLRRRRRGLLYVDRDISAVYLSISLKICIVILQILQFLER